MGTTERNVVYIALSYYDFEGEDLLGIFTTPDLAKQYIQSTWYESENKEYKDAKWEPYDEYDSPEDSVLRGEGRGYYVQRWEIIDKLPL